VYQRYNLQTRPAPDIAPHPSRFRVRVRKHGLASLLLRELIQYRGTKRIVMSRPCMYGVFSGPVGGFLPREHLCVGCLRCTTQYPEFVQIYPNREHRRLGDSYFTPEHVETISYEARTGRVPVKGAGFRGPFGGEGWDGMWTDMSEIVRPTRDGIHGREFISTVVDIGPRPPFLTLDEQGGSTVLRRPILSLPIPILFDLPLTELRSERLLKILRGAAHEVGSLLVLPAEVIRKFALFGPPIVPLVTASDSASLTDFPFEPRMLELDGWNENVCRRVQDRFPNTVICLRLGAVSKEQLLQNLRAGIRVFHFVADYHGRGPDGRFVLDVIREMHGTLVDASCRDEVTLLGSGGIVAAEHVPKAIICGLDAVALDTPLLVALQAQFLGECADRATSSFRLPSRLKEDWGIQRVKNLLASWRDQLLEVLGAMGLREVRRLRGEIGRAMFQQDLEREAFSGIEGYGS
jgi:hypothetical protein